MKSFFEIIESLGGSRAKFNLESRIFNISCIVLSILALFATIINVVLGVNNALILMTLFSSLIFLVFFYFTRYKGKFNSLYLPFLFLINIIAGVLWFLNGGTHGPIALGYMLLVIIAVIIGKKRDQVFLISLILVMLVFLFIIEFKYPLSIVGYDDETTRFFDFTSTLLIFIFLTSIIVRALKKNYDDERDLANSNKREIEDSLNYANKIQHALFVSQEEFSSYFNDAFVLNKPKSRVNGDFYWIKNIGEKKIVVVADSAGKGLSVAFMTIFGLSLLNEIIASDPNINSDEMLNELHSRITESLRLDDKEEDSKYKLDISICIIDDKTNKLQFSGAGNPIYLIRDNNLQRLDAEKVPVNFTDLDTEYSKKEIELYNNDRIYLFTDGFINQNGGPQNKKYMSKQFKILLLDIHQLDMQEQKSILLEKHEEWKGEQNEQIDDILIIGIKI